MIFYIQSNTVVTGSWKLSQSQITKIGFAFIVLPVLTNNPISVLIGIYADADNVYLADLFTRLLYSLCMYFKPYWKSENWVVNI